MPTPKLAPPLPNSYWILPGQLLGGEYPGGVTLELTRERLRRLIDAGVTCFLDLTGPGELEPYENELPAGVEHVRMSIRDHGVPQDQEQMQAILNLLREKLAAGGCVYMHCRAGIGRTGTVAACLLIERGLVNEGALDELNRLWQHCSRARSWRYVPETEEQINYVRRWKRPAASASSGISAQIKKAAPRVPGKHPQPAAANRTALDRRERFHGALLGLAIADALVQATNKNKPEIWSDDTAMALCLAESLLECNAFDPRDQVQRYTRWQQEGYLSATGESMGIRPGTAKALALAQWRAQPFCGLHDPNQQDPEALSRLAPVVMFFFSSLDEAMNQACDAARVTCQSPLVLDACKLFAAMLHAALRGQSKAALRTPNAPLLSSAPLDKRIERAARYRAQDKAATSPRSTLASGKKSSASLTARSADTIANALKAALQAFDRTHSFQEGALQLAQLNAPYADVAASAYGQLAGAHYGVRAIPAIWRQSLRHGALIESFAQRLTSTR